MKKSKRKFQKKYLETNDNERTVIQNLWDATKAVLRGTFTEIQSYINNNKKCQPTYKLTPKTTRERSTKSKVRKKQIIKIRAEINKIEIKKAISKINETKSWFFQKIKLINLQPGSSRKQGRGHKSVKLEMKKEKLQLTLQKY